MELSKSDKKAARIIIEKGLMKQFANGLQQFSKILKDWEENASDNRETYHTLYQSVKNFDKHIARRYDGMTGSHYLFIVAAQLIDKAINEKELESLSESARQAINTIAYLHKGTTDGKE